VIRYTALCTRASSTANLIYAELLYYRESRQAVAYSDV